MFHVVFNCIKTWHADTIRRNLMAYQLSLCIRVHDQTVWHTNYHLFVYRGSRSNRLFSINNDDICPCVSRLVVFSSTFSTCCHYSHGVFHNKINVTKSKDNSCTPVFQYNPFSHQLYRSRPPNIDLFYDIKREFRLKLKTCFCRLFLKTTQD